MKQEADVVIQYNGPDVTEPTPYTVSWYVSKEFGRPIVCVIVWQPCNKWFGLKKREKFTEDDCRLDSDRVLSEGLAYIEEVAKTLALERIKKKRAIMLFSNFRGELTVKHNGI